MQGFFVSNSTFLLKLIANPSATRYCDTIQQWKMNQIKKPSKPH